MYRFRPTRFVADSGSHGRRDVASERAPILDHAIGQNQSATGEAHDLQWMKAPPR
jgi:hypothetical protein